MENGHLHDDKLFRAVHDRLSDYEAPSNGADWDAMSRSLDALPKSSRFQWKISLNSILVLIGVVGISALGFALATHTPEKNTNSTPEVVAKQNIVPVKNNVPDKNYLPVATNLQGTNSVATNTTQPENLAPETSNALTNPDGSVKIKKRNNKLLFGDQIDPRKGFIYNTKENGNVITQPITDPNPNIFYDSENGTIKKIEIKKDSSGIKSIIRPHNPDSTKPVAPTEGDRQGFDIGG